SNTSCKRIDVRVYFDVFLALLITPLIPYTTLFRSRAVRPRRDADRGGALGGEPVPADVAVRVDPADRVRLVESEPQRPVRPEGDDRKSTRLNSSHVKISYAVMCLKKKNHRI